MTKRTCVILALTCILALFAGCAENTDFMQEQPENAESQAIGSKNIVTDRFLYWQYHYAKSKNIGLNEMQKQEKLAAWLSKQDLSTPSSLQVKAEHSYLTGQDSYKLTNSKGDFFYRGETKDNVPDGFGILSQKSNYFDDLGTIIYIGEFKDGLFDGYGLRFSEPDPEDMSILSQMKASANDEEFVRLYYGFGNYVNFEGEFRKGERSGSGNSFLCSVYYSIMFAELQDKGLEIGDTDYYITVGNFKNDKENGSVKRYSGGVLEYDGSVKDGKRDGKGIEYYVPAQSLKYNGDFKNDKYDGKGILYDESGKEIYSGNWKNGDYA